MKYQIVFLSLIVFAGISIQNISGDFADEFDHFLDEKNGLIKEIEELDKKLQSSNKDDLENISELIKNSTITTPSKITLLEKYLKVTNHGVNEAFIRYEIKGSSIFTRYLRRNLLAFIIAQILEQDVRNCPTDLVEGLLKIGAKPGDEQRIKKDVFDENEDQGARCILKEMESRELSESCKKCAQKFDDLFNEYKRKEADKKD